MLNDGGEEKKEIISKDDRILLVQVERRFPEALVEQYDSKREEIKYRIKKKLKSPQRNSRRKKKRGILYIIIKKK